jgi:hypothetical protein
MANEVGRVLSLEERINQKIHESIGDLITPEDLKRIVERGIESALFQPRQTPRQYGGYDTKPSIVDEVVTRALETAMRDAVNAWVKDNPEKLEAAVKEAIARGAGESLLRAIDYKFAGMFDAGISHLRNQGLLPPAPY